MESAQGRIGLLLSKSDEVSKFRVFSFFFKGGKAEREIDMRVGVEFLKFGDSDKNFRGELRIKISFPCNESIPFFPQKFRQKLLEGNVRVKMRAIRVAG